MDENTKTLAEGDKVFDLVDVIEEGPARFLPTGLSENDIEGIVSKVAEKIAREMFPPIAERIIREEIAILKESAGK